MKRQRIRNAEFRERLEHNADDFNQQDIGLQRQRPRPENVLQAQILPGDTLQALALRYNCTISDLKRLNKIEKEIEIHARRTLKVPINAQNVLLNTMANLDLPAVHKSGQNSPKHPIDGVGTSANNANNSRLTNSSLDSIAESSNRLLSHNIQGLNEKLLVASVSCASNGMVNGHIEQQPSATQPNDIRRMNDIIMNSSIATKSKYRDDKSNASHVIDSDYPLLLASTDSDEGDYATLQSGPHVIRGAPRNDFSCSGSDCDISWICLLVVILALCFAIPLIYVIYIAEHPEEFSHHPSE